MNCPDTTGITWQAPKGEEPKTEELKVTRTEQQRTLGDRLACVQAALVFANEERDEARYALDSVEERARLQLAKQLAEELEPMRAELASCDTPRRCGRRS